MLRHTTATNRWGGGVYWFALFYKNLSFKTYLHPEKGQMKLSVIKLSFLVEWYDSRCTPAHPVPEAFQVFIHLRRLSLNTHLLKSRQKKVFHSGECGGSTERAAVFSQCDGTSFSSSLRQQSQMRLFELVVLLILFRAVQNALWGLRLRRWCPECMWAVVSITWEINVLLNLYYPSVDLKF